MSYECDGMNADNRATADVYAIFVKLRKQKQKSYRNTTVCLSFTVADRTRPDQRLLVDCQAL